MCTDYKNIINWNSTPALQTETFTQSFEYDAMNRPVKATHPDQSWTKPTYNKAGLLETMKMYKSGAPDSVIYITNINYNEKGQRTEIYYGNASKTAYTYDDLTFKLNILKTTRPKEGNPGEFDTLQEIFYTYDPVGNITQLTDAAQQTHYFNNSVIAPTGTYTYDALYRLKEATGRELTSLQMATNTDFVNDIGLPNPASNAMQNYTQQYNYDELGNIEQMKSVGQWTRDYYYDFANDKNYLLGHTDGSTEYSYDAHGNITTMPHLPDDSMWDYKDQLKEVTLNESGDKAYYVYDTSGERVRKIIEKGNIIEERIYLGGYEVYRKTNNGTLEVERESLFVEDGTKKIAQIDDDGITQTIRYQYDNLLGSASLELDENADIISYEEYHPYGTTSYRSGRTETEVSLKRYKYVGKERDNETGLNYYGARYYAAWLGRFVSVDPLQFDYPQLTPYNYAGNKPVTHIDIEGMQGTGDIPVDQNTSAPALGNGITDSPIKPEATSIDITGLGPTPSEAAAMAEDVYDPSGNILEGGWMIAVNPVEGMAENNADTGFKSALYERQLEDGSFEYAYVTAGTDGFTDYLDNVANVEQALEGATPQYGQSIDNARLLDDALQGKGLTFVGHSLGGGLASANSLATGRPAITFNAAGLSDKTKTNYGLNKSGKIDAFIVKGEVLDYAQNNSKKLNTAEGNRIELPAPSAFDVTVFGKSLLKDYRRIENHTIGKMKEALNNSGY